MTDNVHGSNILIVDDLPENLQLLAGVESGDVGGVGEPGRVEGSRQLGQRPGRGIEGEEAVLDRGLEALEPGFQVIGQLGQVHDHSVVRMDWR